MPHATHVGRLSVALAAALMVSWAHPAEEKSAPPAPAMKLSVSTHHGFLPVYLTLEGKVEGFDPAVFETCLLSVEWSYTTPGGLPLTSKKYVPCVDAADADKVPAAFKRKETLSEAGIYSYRIVMKSKEGKQYASTSQEVKVIKAPVEVDARATHRDDR